MKAMILYLALFALLLFLVPMMGTRYELPALPPVHTPTTAVPTAPATAATEAPAEPPPTEGASPDEASSAEAVESFRILDETTGEVREVPVAEFVRGAVAAEMPASFHPEALKAQAVAAHTYALHNHRIQLESPDPALMGADFAADPANLRVYITEEIARDFYGEAADECWRKVAGAADAVSSYVLEYDGEPIVAAYHAISGGMTEDAANVWSGSAPYLVPVESGGDMLAPDYETTVMIPPEELRARLTAAYPDIILAGDPAAWFGEITRTDSGYVSAIKVGDMPLHGKDVRLLLDLRSHNFEVLYTDSGFQFVVVGYGHGVGLSQNGANYMANQGASFREILETYYPGTELVEG